MAASTSAPPKLGARFLHAGPATLDGIAALARGSSVPTSWRPFSKDEDERLQLVNINSEFLTRRARY